MDQQIQRCVRGGKLANSKIDFTKDSEYIRLFGDDAMKQQSELIERWVEKEEEKRPPPMPPKSPYK